MNLLLGDSHISGFFGQSLAKRIGNCDRFGCVSSAPENWIRGVEPAGMHAEKNGQIVKMPTIGSVLLQTQYQQVFVCLGTNSLLETRADLSYSQLARLISAHAKLYWIGPPNLRPDQSKGFPAGRLMTMEKNLFGFCDSLKSLGAIFLDSRAPTVRGLPGGETVDGVHRGPTAGAAWANALPIGN